MAQFTVDSGEIVVAAQQTRTTTANIRSEVAAMMAHLITLQQSWTGTASQAFGACADQWRATQATVEASLEQVTMALDTAARTYDDAESAAQGLFAR
ncbi:WXG100 family type VII secretion target [Georgenia deserti]|uniref:ESAT-6-like protein n=1 Tax=Georgenia deserti TaxID=2093781 RepID=A0ABW4L6A0_9MICO